MIDVSTATKRAYFSDVSNKQIVVEFPDLAVQCINDSIVAESLKITESLSTRDSVEFVGCIASSLQIKLYNVTQNLKNQRVEVSITADNTDTIPIFKGIVDSVVIESDKLFKTITAYDVLYSKGETDVAFWYEAVFPTLETTKTLKEIRDSFFNYIDIEQEEVTLPNDNVVIGKKFEPQSLKCITVLKSICQINGCCGIIGRDGQFKYRFLKKENVGIYPSIETFPSMTTFPSIGGTTYSISFHEKLKFEEYYVKPTERVQIRESENDSGVIVGEGSNKYIIQSNMFAQGLVEEVLQDMATNILNKLDAVEFYPFNANNNGLPFIEVGDTVKYAVARNRDGSYATNQFIVLSRTMSGIQVLKDQFNAVGNEEQSEFITDLQAQIDTIKMNGGGGGDTYTKEETDDLIDEKISESMLNVVSCAVLPSTRAQGTIYLVQGDMWMG